MDIKILGCSGGIGPGRRTTALLVDGRILLDAGTGVGDLEFEEMVRIEDVLLTHSHLDHVCSLPLMVDTLLDRIDRPVRVHATYDTIGVLRAHVFNWKLWPDFTELPSTSDPRLRYFPIAPGESRRLRDIEVVPFRVLHTVPGVGYALQASTGTFAFTGDTYASDAIWTALNDLPRLDYLMIEVSFLDHDADIAKASRHLTPTLLASELEKLRHRPEILLTHPKPGYEAAIIEQCRSVLAGRPYRHLQRGDVIHV